MDKWLTTSRHFLAALLGLAIAVPGCSRDPQASLEEAVRQRDGRRVEALLDRGAELAPAISTTYNGSRVATELAHDETEFHKIITLEEGYLIKLPSGPYRVRGRLIDHTIEAESLEFLGSDEEMQAAMTIPLSRFLRSTVKAHGTYMAKFIASKSSRPSDSSKPQAQMQ